MYMIPIKGVVSLNILNSRREISRPDRSNHRQ